MKIKLITKNRYLIEGEKDYEKRLKYYCDFTETILLEVKKVKYLKMNY